MPSLSTILAYAGFAGALVSWIAGAAICARALMAQGGNRGMVLLAPFAWPLIGRAKRASEAAAAQLNKALVAFIACMLLGTAAFAASANLSRFAK